ncbi:MobB family relaxase [Flagellimonas sp.]|uniref:MobB family relaxase n=1 Tax=Flagellimonas sp. TaxID=2058762 RepID=UPI003BAE49D8
MYIAISKQHMGGNFSGSVRDFVNYLEKENEDRAQEQQEKYFDQYESNIDPETVIAEIDGNTAKLGKKDPKFYSLVVSPSQGELKHIGNDPEKLRQYTREVMKAYADAFHRDWKVTVDDLKYYAKLERERTYSETDRKVKENQPFASKILEHKNEIRRIEQDEATGNIQRLQQRIRDLEREAPHQQNGRRIVPGMAKEGHQSHIHIIVSRKDRSNSHSLSPLTPFRANETILNGKAQKQGFHREKFYKAAEATFDKQFSYKRNFVERYTSRNLLDKDPKKFFGMLAGLPANERQAAFQLLNKAGINLPTIPVNQAQVAYKALMKLKRGIGKAMDSGSIGI